MKKAGLITIILAISAIFSFNIKAQNMNNKKILVAYYSWSGNTRTMAHMIKEAVQADIWEIIPENPTRQIMKNVLLKPAGISKLVLNQL